MGRTRPAWYYRRQATEAEARETFFANRQPPPEGTVVNERGASTTLYYRSLLQKSGTDHKLYAVNVLDENLALLTAAEAGLLETIPAGENADRMRGSGLKPSKIHWYSGAATATKVNTQWGTSWTKYYNDGGGRSHYSVPVSEPTGEFDAQDLIAKFDLYFGGAGTKRAALLGAKNGRAHLEFEQFTFAAQT